MAVLQALIRQYFVYILKGGIVTLEVTAGAGLLSLLIATPLAMGRLSHRRLLSWPCSVYVEAIRNTPALLQIFIVYFGLAEYGLNLSALEAGIASMGFLEAAYLSEIFRAGIEGVDPGQIEAALSLGMPPLRVWTRVTVPQAVTLIIPPITNFVIMLLKDTSLLLIITLPEIMYRAYNVANITYRSMQVYTIAGIIYFAICFPLSRLAKASELRTARARAAR